MSSPQSLSQFSRQVVEIFPLFIREFAKRENHELSRGIISLPQMVALDYVSRKSRVTMSEIAKTLAIKTTGNEKVPPKPTTAFGRSRFKKFHAATQPFVNFIKKNGDNKDGMPRKGAPSTENIFSRATHLKISCSMSRLPQM